jgi:uncharacterized protein (UPF0335 family)
MRSRSNTRSKNGKSIDVGKTTRDRPPPQGKENAYRSFVERIERVDAEIKALNRDKAEIFDELKGAGFDTVTTKVLIRRRRQESVVVQLADELLETYERVMAGGYFDGLAQATAAQHQAREHGRVDARADNREHEHLYPDGTDGHADYWIGRQEIEMASTEADVHARLKEAQERADAAA